MAYVKTAKPSRFRSGLENKITSARNQIMNFKYDPMQDASYQALAQIYGARGEQAAQDTLGDAASLNGGYGTSYAVSAAQQARNQYNQELAALVPDLEQNAYNRMQTNYSLLADRENDLYSRYRDLMADYQWAKGFNADAYQFKKNYGLSARETKLAEDQFKWQKKKSSGSGGGGGGGGRRRSGGGGYSGGYSGGGGSASSLGKDYYGMAESEVAAENKKPKSSGGDSYIKKKTKGGAKAVTAFSKNLTKKFKSK